MNITKPEATLIQAILETTGAREGTRNPTEPRTVDEVNRRRPCQIAPRSLPGIYSSLNKKGIIRSMDYAGTQIVYLTDKGVQFATDGTRMINATDLQHPKSKMPNDEYMASEHLEQNIEMWVAEQMKHLGARNLRPHPHYTSHTPAALKTLKYALHTYLQTLVVDVEYTSD